MIELAQAIVKDGEGATKFVTVAVEEASSVEEALETAYTIAHSPLIKTALFASDPNWGRILAALGRAPLADLDLSAVRIYLNDVLIVEQGARAESYTEAQGQSVMDQDEITITLRLARGVVSEQLWTCDLSHDYVTINAEYRT
jgi:glutamate N-acetyltransferase/amino-acid N-acetyltransferase